MSNYNEGDKVLHLPTGTTGYLRDINPNDNHDSDEYWAELISDQDVWSVGSGMEIDSQSDVELITAYADIPVRKLPTDKEIAAAIALDSFTFQHEETYFADPGAIEIVATTEYGLRFVTVVKVVSVYRADA